MRGVRFGRFGETAMWILVALRGEPHTLATLLDSVRALDGQIGPGTFFAAIARLERAALIENIARPGDPGAYRLTARGAPPAVALIGGAVR